MQISCNLSLECILSHAEQNIADLLPTRNRKVVHQVEFADAVCEILKIDGNTVAKIWLRPVSVEHNHGYNRAQLNYILKLTRENQARLLMNWNEYFAR
jgi:hypothetical protein